MHIPSYLYRESCFNLPVRQLALRGTVTTVAADNLGSHGVGGFKEGGRALRCCRHCMVPTDDMDSKVSVLVSTILVPLEIV